MVELNLGEGRAKGIEFRIEFTSFQEHSGESVQRVTPRVPGGRTFESFLLMT